MSDLDLDDDDFAPSDAEPCDHEEYEVDTLDGRAYCRLCREAWTLSSEELARELELEAECCAAYAAECAAATESDNEP